MSRTALQSKIPRWLFSKDLEPRLSVVLTFIVLISAWGVWIALAARSDGTLHLPPPGRGLLDHYGFQATFLSGPLVLLTMYLAVSSFMRALNDIGILVDSNAGKAAADKIVEEQVHSVLLRSRWRNLLWFFMFVGVAASFAIFTKLDHPANYWGNDVFNAKAYRNGYIAANSYLVCLWGFMYPVGFFYALHLTLSGELSVARLSKRGLLRLNFLHADNCGGMSRFGTVNFLVMLTYAWPFCAMYALHITHRYTYSSLVAASVVTSLAFLLQGVYGIHWVSRAIRVQKSACIEQLNGRIRKSMDDNHHDFAAAVATMEYRDRVIAISPFPYSGNISLAVKLLGFAPTILTVAKYLTTSIP